MAEEKKVYLSLEGDNEQISRRDVLKMTGMAIGALAAMGIASTPPSKNNGHGEGDSPYHWGMLVDIDLCIGCNYCVEFAPAQFQMSKKDGKTVLLHSVDKKGFHTIKSQDYSILDFI